MSLNGPSATSATSQSADADHRAVRTALPVTFAHNPLPGELGR